MKTVWQKIQAVCSILCIVVYAVSTFYAVLLIHNTVTEHRALTEREYAELKDFTASAGILGWTEASFEEDILDAVSDSKTLQAVIITGTGNYSIAVEKTPGIIQWAGNKPHFTKGLYLLKHLETVPLRIEGRQNIAISAVSTYIDFDNLLFILRKALIAILAAVVVSFTMLIAELVLIKKPEQLKNGRSEDAPPRPQLHETETVFDDEINVEEDKNIEDDLLVEENEEAAENEENENEESFEEFNEEFNNDEDEEYETVHDSAADLYESDNFGSFDDEPTFADELGPELERAEETDQDLALITAAWVEENISDKVLIDTAAKCFKHECRIFQKNIPGIYIIVHNMNLEEAFERAKRFHREATGKLPQDFKSSLLIGISSRAGRSVHAARLVNETERALGKAGEDKRTPIIAFKADLEKYREFIARANVMALDEDD